MTELAGANRLLMALGALCGAAGVGLAARGSHASEADITIAANFLLLHAPGFMVIGLLGSRRWTAWAGWLLLGGLILFAADLCCRGFLGTSLFPFAAPLGGIAMIGGWVFLALSLALGR